MAAEPRPSLQVDGVTRRFGSVTALADAWLKVAPGEFLTLLGPSGCGKTTLLNLIAGFLEPDQGEIFIDGALVTEVPVWQRGIGMVFQNYALFPHMTVARNIAYGLAARGIARAEAQRRTAEALALVKLTGMEERRPRQLSGGQQQRVALARALVIRPKLLLLDEPFSALDRNLRGAMQVELREIQRSLGIATIFVTHDQGEALSMSDRVAVMSEGRIRQVGTPEAIYRRPADRFVAGFVGDVNRLPARLVAMEGDSAMVACGACRLAVPAAPLAAVSAGTAVELFLRPEQIRTAAPGTPGLTEASVAARAFHGDHADLHCDVPGLPQRLLLRVPGHAAEQPGARLALLPDAAADAVAFPLGG
jgi:putative spermidine/putrescine transport system ATP-binding protein/spermidine/putrescine transport system ATP-binding protein